MKRKIVSIITVLILVQCICFAQQQPPTSAILPHKLIIFSDDFENDQINSYPEKWQPIKNCDNIRQPASQYCSVQEIKGVRVLKLIPDLNKPSLLDYIEPNLDTEVYLPDTFLLSFDFFLESMESSCELMFKFYHESFLDKCILQRFSIVNNEKGRLILYNNATGYFGTGLNRNSRNYVNRYVINDKPNYEEWHKCSFLFNKSSIDCYFDNQPVAKIQDCGYKPTSFLLTCSQGNGAIRVKNVLLTTDRKLYLDSSRFDKLIVQNKLVTTDIHFDFNSLKIQQQSMDYLKQFSLFLMKHPGVKLYINGYTDNIGTERSNKTLSFQRAAAIKNVLVNLGISIHRLKIQGFGSCQPIADNSTREGRAKNRRVEFVVSNKNLQRLQNKR